MKRMPFFVLMGCIMLSACGTSTPVTPEHTYPRELPTDVVASIELTSNAFMQGQPIPDQYSCKDKNISPALSWGEPPAGTQSFALIMDDLDSPGGIWTHWVIFNIPASTRSLPEAISAETTLPDGSMSGNSSFGGPGYGGPCPPGGTHRYVFKLYALDEMLGISAGANKGELEKAIVGHILAQGELMGTFTK
jgi:Raf kinase inhibitor-like YbhB/YbcL family protein